MNKQDLLKLGIEDEELVQKIVILHGKDIEKFKAELETKQNEFQALQEQYQEADKTIAGFKEMDIEGIKTAAEEWRTKAEQAQVEAEQKIQSLKFEHALEENLRLSGAKNLKAVKALLELDSIKFSEDGSKLEGIVEQLETVKTENNYLFESENLDEEEDSEPKIVSRTRNRSVLGDAAALAARKAAGLPI
jgi:hypothetical protein